MGQLNGQFQAARGSCRQTPGDQILARMICVWLMVCVWLMILTGCGQAESGGPVPLPVTTANHGWQFVRSGILAPAEAGKVAPQVRLVDHTGRGFESDQDIPVEPWHLADGRVIWKFTWRPRVMYHVRTATEDFRITAPQEPCPLLVATLSLENVDQIALSGAAPDAVVRFAPNSHTLALATFGGILRIIDGDRGQLLHEQRIAEGMIKTLAWSSQEAESAATLLVGEQSPDALLQAWQVPRGWLSSSERPPAGSLQPGWQVAFSEWIESSRLPPENRFGIYTLPAVHDLAVAADGRVFALGFHSWTNEGSLRNRTALACFDPQGTLLWKLPPESETGESAWPLSITHFAIDQPGQRLVFLASQSSAEEISAGIPQPGTFCLVDAMTGELLDQESIPPQTPEFDRVESWDSVSVAADGSRAVLGLVDGRALLYECSEKLQLLKTFDLGTTLQVGTIPVAAPASYCRFAGDRLVLETQNSHIPRNSAQAALQAPSPHYGENMLTVADLQGQPLWKYHGPFALSGVELSQEQGRAGEESHPRWLMVECRDRPGAAAAGQFGFLLFDLDRSGTASEKLVYYYPTPGPVVFQADISSDGQLIAVVEHPTPAADGEHVEGYYRLHIVH